MIYDQNSLPYKCVCSVLDGYTAAGDICLFTNMTSYFDANSDYSVNQAKQILYDAVENDGITNGKESHESGTIEFYYLQAAVGCREYDDP